MKLILDFDGTLHHSDLLWEQFIRVAKHRPLSLIPCIASLISGGRPALKKTLHNFCPKTIQLPWNGQILDFAANKSDHGYEEVVVVTASDENAAREHLQSKGLDWAVYGTRDGHNAKGAKKISVIHSFCGNHHFCYVGDSQSADIPVWKASKKTGFVGHRNALQCLETNLGRPFDHFFDKTTGLPNAILKAIRPHQWLKNLLVFIPVFAAHQIANTTALISAIYAFIALSLIASAVYLLNDLCDLDADRIHPEKKQRPLASGDLSIWVALILIPLMLGAGFGVSLLVPTMLPIVLIYFALTTLYSLYFKHVIAIDICALSILYTLRVLAGAFACQIEPSIWLLAFSFFTFFALATGKRFSELVLLGNSITNHRAYTPAHGNTLLALGAGASMISAFLPALYSQDPQVDIYSNPEFFLFLMPLIGTWFARFWLLAAEGKITSDPVLFAAKDKFSWICGIALVALGIIA
jgi:4-hydroxybenzoate polyprenyltransferase